MYLEVLSHQPGLEGRVEKRRSHAAEQAPHKQDIKIVPVLGEAAKGVSQDINDAGLLSPSAARSRIVSS